MDINLHSVKSLYIRNRLKGSVSFVFTRLRPGGPETGAVELATNLSEVLQSPENDPWAFSLLEVPTLPTSAFTLSY